MTNDPPLALPGSADLLALARRIGDVRWEGMSLVANAIECTVTGRAGPAAVHLLDALDLGRRVGFCYLEELSLFILVVTAALAGEAEDAARLHGTLTDEQTAIRARLSAIPIMAYDATVDSLRASLGATRFDRVSAGGALLSWREALVFAEELAAAIIADATPEPANGAPSPPAPLLSRRELQVLELIAAGASNKDVAAELGLRPKTVMHYTSSIYRKLGVRSRTEAAAVAWRSGLLRDTRTGEPSGADVR